MKLITINPNNEKYYSEDFAKGFECGAKRQFEADLADTPQWIPCSERLPSNENDVLITLNGGKVYAGFYNEKAWWHMSEDGDVEPINEILQGGVIVWMPLPPCYQGE